MSNWSNELTWAATRDTHCYLLRRSIPGRSGMGKAGVEFTMEPNNLTSRNSWKYSGLCNAKTVGLEATEGGVVLTTKSRNPARIGKVRRTGVDRACSASEHTTLPRTLLARRPPAPCALRPAARAPSARPLGTRRAPDGARPRRDRRCCRHRLIASLPLTRCCTNRCRPSQPSKMYNKVTLTKDFRRVAKAITKETADNYYRPDLKKGAPAELDRTVQSAPPPDRRCPHRAQPVPHAVPAAQLIGCAAALAKWSLIYAAQKKKAKK